MTKATKKALKPGERMEDGTIFAGISPDTNKNMFVTPEDAPDQLKKWKEAMEYAASLDAHGHKDWKLPTKEELRVIFKNSADIGNFNTEPNEIVHSDTQHLIYLGYASSSEQDGGWYGEYPKEDALFQNFGDGQRRWNNKDFTLCRARPVRLESRRKPVIRHGTQLPLRFG